MSEALIETQRDTIFCPGCGEELEVPKPKVEFVEYHPAKTWYSTYGDYAPYVEVHFNDTVRVDHKCPDPNHDRAGAAIEEETRRQLTAARGRKFQLWN